MWTRCLVGLTLLLSLVSSCASPDARVEEAPRFVFQDSFWVNLHHFLRAEARRRARGSELLMPLGDSHEEQREAWSSALDAYGDLSQRSLLFDEELVRINAALAGVQGLDSLPEGVLAPDLTAALNGTAPIYRVRLRPEHSRLNREWIAETEPTVQRHAAALTEALSSAYRVAWPAAPILIDACSETGPFLAYTTCAAPAGFAGHITISPGPLNRGAVALECVLHEASHVVDGPLRCRIDEECARQGLESPADLWHALIYFTSGVLTQRALGAAGTYRADLAREFPAYLVALDRHWQPYLEGRAPFDQALHDFVREACGQTAVKAGGE